MSSTNEARAQLTFPAPEQLLWICPACGPAGSSRLEPSQVFRRSPLGGSSEWRKIECCGCSGRFMLRINSEGWVTAQAIDSSAPPTMRKAGYSAVDPDQRGWLTA
jgi:hypothetical protein